MMAPKKAPAIGTKGKKKVEDEVEMTPKSNFSEMQYLEGVIFYLEWDSHIRRCKISDYNHRIYDNKKELDALLSTKTKKYTVEDMPVYDDTGEKFLKQ
ncbi:hypothetical protein KI387_022190, partial [Taxus chinensis]